MFGKKNKKEHMQELQDVDLLQGINTKPMEEELRKSEDMSPKIDDDNINADISSGADIQNVNIEDDSKADGLQEMEDFMDIPDIPELPEKAGKKKKKLPGWVIIPIILLLLLIFFGLSKLSGGGQEKIQTLDTVAVEKDDIKQIYNTSGTVESGRTKVFYSPVNAPINGFAAKVGNTVKAGDLLVSFDVTNLARDNQQSQLNALATKYSNQDAVEQSNRAASSQAQTQAQAAASMADLQNQIAAKQAEVNDLQNQMSQASGEAAQNAAKAAEIQQQMTTNLNDQSNQKAIKDNAELELAKLNPNNYGDKEKYDTLLRRAQDATSAISSLEIAYRDLQSQLDTIGATDASGTATALAAAQQELDSLNSSLSQMQNSSTPTTDTGITSAQAANMQVSENLTELASLTTEELLAKGQEGVKAEFDGIISDVKAAQGTDAVQGGELFTLVSNTDVNVKLEVSSNDFDNLAIGNKAQIKVGKKTYQGTLTQIDKIALVNEKGSSTIGAKVHIDNPDEDLYIGVNAKVIMTVDEVKKALCLPIEVVNTATSGDFVYIIENGIVKKQPVELGISSSSKVQIVSGLKEGTQVVSDTAGLAKEGMKATGMPIDSDASKEE